MITTSDPVGLEILRTRLESIADEAAIAIERTAISPVITESKDFSSAILDGQGELLVGAGKIQYHLGAASHVVKNTIAVHGAGIADGDVFIANDPHSGGQFHPQNVVIQRPVFARGARVGWIVSSGHMIDVGGMTPGSWSPDATECYQEALRLPPVRLVRGGAEVPDMWNVLRTNVRQSALVEMDIRGLIAGCHVAAEKLVELVCEIGLDRYVADVRTMCALSEQEMRRRIDAIADGTYRATTWTEWEEEFFRIPCQLTVSGDTLTFDFTGASEQCPHFFNSKPFIIESELVTDVWNYLAQDLPFTSGVFGPITCICPEGSIVNCTPPAPIANAHMDVAYNACAAGMQCLMLALAATPDPAAQRLLSGPISVSSLAMHSWSGRSDTDEPCGWVMLEGSQIGSSARHDADGADLFPYTAGTQSTIEHADIEILESWYPILISRKQVRQGTGGAGRYRAGAGCHIAYRTRGAATLSGVMLGMRERIPLAGWAGGLPGATTAFRMRRGRDQVEERVAPHATGVRFQAGDEFELLCGSGGGFGDPVDRDPAAVAADVRSGRIDREGAAQAYGVAVTIAGTVDASSTGELRRAILCGRLAQAIPPTCPGQVAADPPAGGDEPAVPLYPGVEQRGSGAVSARTGVILARPGGQWLEGCSRLRLTHDSSSVDVQPSVDVWAYLDPMSGHIICTDVVPAGEPPSFASAPLRWTKLAANATES